MRTECERLLQMLGLSLAATTLVTQSQQHLNGARSGLRGLLPGSDEAEGRTRDVHVRSGSVDDVEQVGELSLMSAMPNGQMEVLARKESPGAVRAKEH